MEMAVYEMNNKSRIEEIDIVTIIKKKNEK